MQCRLEESTRGSNVVTAVGWPPGVTGTVHSVNMAGAAHSQVEQWPWSLKSLLASWVVYGATALAVFRAGFKWRSARVSLNRGGARQKTQTLHFLERAPEAYVDRSPVPTLVLIPGLTMEAPTFLALVRKLHLPHFRIVVVELPAQGANRCRLALPLALPSLTLRLSALLAKHSQLQYHNTCRDRERTAITLSTFSCTL